MSSVRAMLARVQRLEEERTSPWVRLFGPWEDFEQEVHSGIREGRYDSRDMPIILECLRRWVRQC